MHHSDRQEMDTQTLGRALMIGSGVGMLLFLIGVLRRSYLILALPVTASVAACAALTFWLGWTLAGMEEDEATADVQRGAVMFPGE
jgi:hypothetical protein